MTGRFSLSRGNLALVRTGSEARTHRSQVGISASDLPGSAGRSSWGWKPGCLQSSEQSARCLEHAGTTSSPARCCATLAGHPLNDEFFRRTKLTKFLKHIKDGKQIRGYFYITISAWMQRALDASFPAVHASCTVVHTTRQSQKTQTAFPLGQINQKSHSSHRWAAGPRD